MKKNLDNKSLLKYSRQIILKDVGVIGQKKIINSKVLVIGAGGLGSPVIDLLARAGVGQIPLRRRAGARGPLPAVLRGDPQGVAGAPFVARGGQPALPAHRLRAARDQRLPLQQARAARELSLSSADSVTG